MAWLLTRREPMKANICLYFFSKEAGVGWAKWTPKIYYEYSSYSSSKLSKLEMILNIKLTH